MAPPSCTELLAEEVDGVLSITFNRPKRKNAISGQCYKEMTELLKYAQNSESVRVVVLTGSGDFYSSGNDLTVFLSVDLTDSAAVLKALTDAKELLFDFVNAFISLDKVLVAVVNGPSIGVACTHLAFCDFLYTVDTYVLRENAGAPYQTNFLPLFWLFSLGSKVAELFFSILRKVSVIFVTNVHHLMHPEDHPVRHNVDRLLVLIPPASAYFHTPFTSLAQCPECCSSYTFPKLIGRSRAKDVLLGGRKFTGAEAAQWGFATASFPTLAQAQEAAKTCVQNIIESSDYSTTRSQLLMKSDEEKAILRKVATRECDLLLECWTHPGLFAAVMKFMNRSRPKL